MMSSKENLIFNHGKKVWKPSSSVDEISSDATTAFLNIVSSCKNKVPVLQKREYQMKINQIGTQLTVKDKLDELPIQQIPVINSTNARLKPPLELKHRLKIEEIQKIIEVRSVNHEIERTLAFKMVRNERRHARKISLEWSAYSSTASCSAVMAAKLDDRFQYLQRKYIAKWKKFVKKRITVTSRIMSEMNSKKSEDENMVRAKSNCSSPSLQKLYGREKNEKSEWQNVHRKVMEQTNKIKELELTRLKLEEQLYARDVQEMLKENEKCNRKTSTPTILSQSSSCNPKRKNDKSKLKVGWELVTRMELRAQERQQRWDNIREKKQMLEIERAEKLRIQEEKRKRQEDEEKKQKSLEVKREIKRRVELRKKQEEERVRLYNLNAVADEHYRIHLLRISFLSLVLYLNQCRSSMAHAERFYNFKLLSKSLVALNLFRKIEIIKKSEIADQFYENLILQRSFDIFKKLHLEYMRKLKDVEESTKLRLMKNCFYKWLAYCMDQKCEYLKKNELAVQHYKRSLLRQCFQNWKQLPLIHFQQREKEQRFRFWCNKVQELLPDFQPLSIVEC